MAIAARTPIPSPSLARPQPPQRRRLAAAPTVTARADLQRVTTPIARAAPFELWILFFVASRQGRPRRGFQNRNRPNTALLLSGRPLFFRGVPSNPDPPLSRAKTRILYASRGGHVQLDGPARVTSASCLVPWRAFQSFWKLREGAGASRPRGGGETKHRPTAQHLTAKAQGCLETGRRERGRQ